MAQFLLDVVANVLAGVIVALIKIAGGLAHGAVSVGSTCRPSCVQDSDVCRAWQDMMLSLL